MVDYAKLKELREKTEISFSMCKKALEETNNDMDKAIKLMQKWGVEKAAQKSDRGTSEGSFFSYIHHNKKIASLVEVQCESDFVANNEAFQKMGYEIAMQLASMPAETVEELMEQEYIRDSSKKMSELVKEAILKFGENIKVTKILRWVLGK